MGSMRQAGLGRFGFGALSTALKLLLPEPALALHAVDVGALQHNASGQCILVSGSTDSL